MSTATRTSPTEMLVLLLLSVLFELVVFTLLFELSLFDTETVLLLLVLSVFVTLTL